MKRLLRTVLGVVLVGFIMGGCQGQPPTAGTPQVTIGAMTVRPLVAAGPGDTARLAAAAALRDTLCTLRWVAFAPTHFDPQRGVLPGAESLRADLRVLRQAGFTGLITYSADVLTPTLAQQAGFRGMIVGVWDPRSQQALARARDAARSQIVLGVAVGNEGLGGQYDRATLEAAIEALRLASGKPVTTTEEIEDYEGNAWLLARGDFVLPNVHPYWHGLTDPQRAALWTVEQFRRLAARTTKPILFKEVGLPSAGHGGASELQQAQYYQLLGRSREVCFAHFEAYDQPWKQRAAVEPHWGLFRQDRSPKLVAQRLLAGH